MKQLVVVATLLASGCGQVPQTAEDFRSEIPGSAFGRVQSFEVSRPLREVARTFEAQARECLSIGVRSTDRTRTSSTTVLTTYKPTVVTTDNKVELHVQFHMEGNVVIVGKEPRGGHYTLVADATPLDTRRTRVVIYDRTRSIAGGADTLNRAIKGWAKGENVGCPDLTKD